MITEYIRYQLTTHAPEALTEAYVRAGKHLQAAPECLGYELSQCREEPETFILRIRWISAEAHMERFRRGSNFPPFLALVGPFVGEIIEMRHYSETAAAWAARPGAG